ncbi:5' exonuclease Apollo [Polyrhizophydium stewartii]|uniref:Protein artemis n=1 Tax=Polyrhizophydium stewartii TaxID=2732419 RepID=A0ABR4MYB9_9FUNG
MSIQMLDNSFLQATLLPASHCPGSAMVLLENDSQRVLCTGDFRLEGDLLANLLSSDSLRRDEHGLREISAIYLDTTFANPNWSEFPTRRESAEAVVHLIRSFPSNVQVLLRTERCGYELLWIAVSKEIGVKIHVTKERFRMYQALDKQEPYMLDVFGEAKVSEHLTACESDTRVFSSPCAATDDAKRRGQLAEIVPSAMFWGLAESMAHGQWRICDPGLGRATQSIKDPGMFRVLYSTHPSLSEMLDFVARLKPKRVHPIAVGNKTSPLSLKQVMSHVDFVGTLESARRRAGGSLSAGSRAIAAGPARTTDPRLGWEALALPIEPMQSSSSLARPTRHSSGGPARRVREAAIRDAKARFLAGETLRLRTTRPLRAGREAEAAGGGQ